MDGKVLSLCPRKMRREDIDIKASLGNLVRLSEMGAGKQERHLWSGRNGPTGKALLSQA